MTATPNPSHAAAVHDQADDVDCAAGDEATKKPIFRHDSVRDPVGYIVHDHQKGDHRGYQFGTQAFIPRLTCHSLAAVDSGSIAMALHQARSSPT
jgi:hypothetical protein